MAALGSLKTLVKRFIDGRTASAVRVLNIYKVQDVHAIGMTYVMIVLRIII